ncbi:MAG: site-specific DNA-methyltransferase [Deltaproteobacteria bacterium]|nr:site-specific DNA-methyltransferase [Deltaproteobacteria bacterium]
MKTSVTKKKAIYSQSGNPLEFYVAEEAAAYGHKKPYATYYDDPERSVKLLEGDCIEILNHARENSIDMIFADPPYFLSNGGITCHAGKMVSVNKGKWDKSKGIIENHKFILDWLKACQRVLNWPSREKRLQLKTL